MAGPCSVESYDQVYDVAVKVKAAGAQFLRGGAFKPRTSPYDFQGLGLEGLKILRDVGDKTGLRVVTEIVDKEDIELVSEYADLLQVGARNMQNFQMLKALGKIQMPILFKRGISATISEWLNAAEYIASGGNQNIIFCERGIRTYETFTRNTMDLNAVAALKELTHFPVIADPSHGTGRWQMVRPLARAPLPSVRTASSSRCTAIRRRPFRTVIRASFLRTSNCSWMKYVRLRLRSDGAYESDEACCYRRRTHRRIARPLSQGCAWR